MFDSLVKTFSTGKSHEFPQIIAIVFGALSGVSNGLLFSWTSPAIPELIASNLTNITLEEASYFTVISPISMALSAPLFSILLDQIGRKKSIMIIAVPQILSWILTALAENVWMFYIGRFIAGIGDAAFYASYPIYVCEISQPHVRGTWGTLTATSVYLGIFLINVIGAFNNIQMTAVICGILPIIQFAIFSIMPESPYYLLMKGKDQEAEKALAVLNWRNDVGNELLSLKMDVARQISEKGSWEELFSIDSNRKALIMCIGFRIAQQFSGLPAFEMYTQYMFQQAGGDISHKTAAIILSGILAASVGLSAFTVEKIGRRPLMIFSCFGCGIILTIESIYFCIVQFTNLDVSKLGWLPLGGMLFYTVICAIGLGTLPTLMSGELFSASIKAKATTIMNIVLALCIITVPKLFQALTHNFGIYAPFCVFSFCCIISGIFSYFYAVETKGKSLEQIQQKLKITETKGNIKA